MQLIHIDPAMVDLGERLRDVNQDWAHILAVSIRENGVRSPIEVRNSDIPGRYTLVAGGHRLVGSIIAEQALIPALIFEGSDLEARLREIEENLIRHELSEMDRATFLAQHKTVYEALHPETRHGGDRRKKASGQDVHLNVHPLAERFSAVAAARIGLDERTIRRSVTRYHALSPVIRSRISGTWIADNGAALDDLIGRGTPLREVEQQQLLDILLDPDSKVRRVNDALRQLRKLPAPETSDGELNALKAAWKRAGAKARREFRAFLNTEGGN